MVKKAFIEGDGRISVIRQDNGELNQRDDPRKAS
jgi:uncharacterized membrane protein YcaP (DUF421 family)